MKISKNAMGNIVAEAAELMNIFLVDNQEFRATITAIIDYCQSGKLPVPTARMKPAFWEYLKAKIDKIAQRAERARLRREQKGAEEIRDPRESYSSESSESSERSEHSQHSESSQRSEHSDVCLPLPYQNLAARPPRAVSL